MKVFMIAAVTADGFIGKHADHFADWTAKEDKRFFMSITKEAGTLIFGSTTFKTIGRPLKDRRNIILTSQPASYQVEGVEFTDENPTSLLKRLESEGVKSIAIGGGSKIYSAFMKAGLIDEVYLTVEPFVFGRGVPLFSEDLDMKLELIENTPLNTSTYVAHYRIIGEISNV